MSLKSDVKNLPKLFSILLKDKERKSTTRILLEFIYLFFTHRSIPTFYFSRHLYKSAKRNIKDYIPNKVLLSLSSKFNNIDEVSVLNNKLFFNLFFSARDIPLTKLLMYNHENIFIYGNEMVKITDPKAFKVLITRLIIEKSSSNSIFIKKTNSSYGGRNTFKLEIIDLTKDDLYWEDLFRILTKSGFLFEETLKQHSDLDLFCSTSLNTMRCDTFIDKSGNINIMSALLRMSTNNSHVDNISSGGCMAGVDIETGKVGKYAFTFFSRKGGCIYAEHPVSKTKFEGFQLPFFNEAKETVYKAASCLPGLRLVGWDIAFGSNGPVLIEGNSYYDITANDLTYGGYRRHPAFRKVLEEINYKHI